MKLISLIFKSRASPEQELSSFVIIFPCRRPSEKVVKCYHFLSSKSLFQTPQDLPYLFHVLSELPAKPALPSIACRARLTSFTSRACRFQPRLMLENGSGLLSPSLRCPGVLHGFTPTVCSARYHFFLRARLGCFPELRHCSPVADRSRYWLALQKPPGGLFRVASVSNVARH